MTTTFTTGENLNYFTVGSLAVTDTSGGPGHDVVIVEHVMSMTDDGLKPQIKVVYIDTAVNAAAGLVGVTEAVSPEGLAFKLVGSIFIGYND